MKIAFDFSFRRGVMLFQAQGELEDKITGVFGPSGAGKTTLLHLVAGIERPHRGYLHINGQTLFDSSSHINVPVHRRQIAVVFQDGRLFPHMTVAKNLRFGEPKGQDRHFSFDEIVTLLELEPLLEKKPEALSGGEGQRVALGRALLCSPRLLLLDEPLASLDRGLKRQILPFLRRIKRETRIPMVYVGHDLSELLQLTDRLLVLNRGRIVGHGPFLDLVRDQRVLDLIHDLGLINVVPLHVRKHMVAEGITLLDPDPGTGRETTSWVGPDLAGVSPGHRVYVTLRPEDIALVRKPVRDISIRNQIQGVIEDIMVSRHKALCLIDTGRRLLAEITPNAIHGMNLKKGQPIWCLFKAQALNYLE